MKIEHQLACAAPLILSLVVAACPAGGVTPGIKVTRAQYGEAWPFTVDSGWVHCPQPSAAVFRHGSTDYQLNGLATSLGYATIDPIWRDNPSLPGLKVNIGPMIDLALQQCH